MANAGGVVFASDVTQGVPVKGVRITNSGNPIGTTSGTTELDMPKYGMSGLTLVTGRYYIYRAQITWTKSVATDTFDLRLRANTAVSGTQVAQYGVNFTDNLLIGTRTVDLLFVGNATYSALFLSLLRTAGSATASYYGTNSGFNRCWAALYDAGDSAIWSDVA